MDNKAIQIQYRDNFFSSASDFDQKIQDELLNEPYTFVTFKGEQIKEYSPGTVIRLETPNEKVGATYLVATAQLNDHGRAIPNRSLKQKSLLQLWDYIAQRGRKEPLVIPIIGSGRGRINVTRDELLHDIVRSFLEAIQNCKFTEELTIVINPKAFIQNKYSLDELEEYLLYVAKFGIL